MYDFKKLSDKELYVICKKWGAEVLAARRKFAGLLPEVWRREKFENERGASWLKRRGFTCLYEFAAKLAGMSRDQVDLVVRVERRLEDKPVLREALVSGKISVNKLARVVSISTAENQRDILEKVETLSKSALEVFVHDFKRADENFNGLQMPKYNQIVVPGHGLKLDEDIENELLQMQEKGLDVNGLLRELLKERKAKLEARKKVVAEKQEPECEDRAIIGYPAKRYVPAEVRKITKEEFGEKCSVAGCSKKSENLHHEKPFAIAQSHNPDNLKPLCKGHHELAHAGFS